MANLIFYLAAATALACGLGVVLFKSPMRSVLSLLGCFFCMAVIYLLAGFQFMAVAQLLVYAGAIMVLFLFVIMLLNLGDPGADEVPPEESGMPRVAALPLGIAGVLLLLGSVAVNRTELGPVDPQVAEEGAESIGAMAEMLFGRYTLPFEAAGVLLLAATVGVLVLAKRQRPDRDVVASPASGDAS